MLHILRHVQSPSHLISTETLVLLAKWPASISVHHFLQNTLDTFSSPHDKASINKRVSYWISTLSLLSYALAEGRPGRVAVRYVIHFGDFWTLYVHPLELWWQKSKHWLRVCFDLCRHNHSHVIIPYTVTLQNIVIPFTHFMHTATAINLIRVE